MHGMELLSHADYAWLRCMHAPWWLHLMMRQKQQRTRTAQTGMNSHFSTHKPARVSCHLPLRLSTADVTPGTPVLRPADRICRKRLLPSPWCRCTPPQELLARPAALHSHHSIRFRNMSVWRPRSSCCRVPGTEEGANLAAHSWGRPAAVAPGIVSRHQRRCCLKLPALCRNVCFCAPGADENSCMGAEPAAQNLLLADLTKATTAWLVYIHTSWCRSTPRFYLLALYQQPMFIRISKQSNVSSKSM